MCPATDVDMAALNSESGAAGSSDDTTAIIQPERKVKEPSLSLVKVLVKHYGSVVLMVRRR